MAAAGVPAAATLPAATAPCVVKADGLAAGKGVFVCHTQAEADAGVRAAAGLGGTIVVEELLEGPEVSLFAICDGQRAHPFGAAQDYKRALDGDAGPNTGGMGAFSPVPSLDEAVALVEQIHQPVVDELARRGAPFVGCLFAGLMLTPNGPRVLEFNARFGDPETQVLIPRVEGDLLEALSASAAGDGTAPVVLGSDAAVTVVLTGPGYPERSDHSGAEIAGIDAAEAHGARVFHGGTARHGDALVTNGGRILSVTATAPTVLAAREVAYRAVAEIGFEGIRYRTDIAAGGDG
jgi:phosphoribosylamine--glycine ligase